ncbi:MAG: DNA-binding NtrC family response regulator [Candidatus Azotimanducaceae bacterium]|jgi:DNA-binding NtrC family response regulator
MSKKNNRILIIEDEALVARELQSRLTKMGCEVVGIAYGREGIELARRTKPDLLLTDIHLKDGEDGIEMAQIIQRERDVPVVFLTAYSDEATVSRAKALAPYGYIIKPVENRELEIAIEMALYKFNIEKKLRETQQLLQNALTCIGNALVFVDKNGRITDLNADAELLLCSVKSDLLGKDWPKILSLQQGSSVYYKIESALKSNEVNKLAPFVLSNPVGLPRLVDGLAGPMNPGGVLILRELSQISDPLESLPETAHLLSELGPDQLSPSESSMCQLLISVDAETISPREGFNDDRIVDEVLGSLNQSLRSTDLVSMYLGTQLSVSMPYTSVEEGKNIAQSILKSLKSRSFLNHEVKFSIGLAHSLPSDQQPFELFRRASWALSVAKESGGGRVIVWTDAAEKSTSSISGEGQMLREYSNLVLLWNVMSVVMKALSLEDMSVRLCEHLLQSYKLRKAVVLTLADTISAIGGAIDDSEFASVSDIRWSEKDFGRIKEAIHKGKFVHFDNFYLFPIAGAKGLFIESKKSLSKADIEFTGSLVTYFSSASARFDLAPIKDSDELAANAMIYSSARMHSIVESCELVAPTDATVLIVGESGTGKEMLARHIHQNSPRANKPFIIVDCGAVVGSLIESELFGHAKGAFTGADKKFTGKLKEANGGTILLDEIGELPLDVQVKLLRFVQEREVVAVGSTVYDSVDTRVIAATNKNLKALVSEGGFREDLFYRLNVFAVETAPLRERREDVMALAHHYIKIYAQRYAKVLHGFSPEAEQALIEYSWPGNIRELTNIVNRGVILCKDSQLTSIHLGLFPSNNSDSLQQAVEPERREAKTPTIALMVDICVAEPGTLPPLGQWLEEDLILMCLGQHQDVLNRAASALGVPESTLRRKVNRIRLLHGDRAPVRPLNWPEVSHVVQDLFTMATNQQIPVLDYVANILFEELETREITKREAANLMGVSLPTYRRIIANSP